MQRKVLTSLEEDFADIGLNRKVEDVGVFGSLDEELAVADRFGGVLEEALKVKKLVRMSPAERAKARADYRSQKSTIKRKRKKLAKKPAHKRHVKKLKKMTKGKSAGAHKRFVVTGLEQIGNLQESIQKFAAEIDGNKKEEMVLTIENISSVASLLAERLDEAEAYIDEMSETEEFGDDEYDDVDHLDTYNPAADNKGGIEDEDVDDGGDVGGMGDELAFLDDEEGEEEEGDSDEALDIDDDESEDSDEALDIDDEEEKTESSNRISDNLRKIVTEAAELLTQFKKEAITPADAEAVLRDMVSYLGGAINTFANIAKGLEGYRDEVGQDQPQEIPATNLKASQEHEVVGQDKDLEADAKVAVETEKRQEVGQDEPVDTGKEPEGQTAKRKVAGEDMKLDDVGNEPENQNEKRTIVGQDKIDDKLEMGTDKPKVNPINQKGKGEISVWESMNLDRFTKELVESVANGLDDENKKTFMALPKQKMIEAAYAVIGSKKKN